MPLARRVLRNADLALLVIALPVWIAAGLPLLGWAAATVAWLASRGLQAYLERRAIATGSRQAALAARAGSLVGRLFAVTLAVLVAGLIDREAGLSAGVLAVVVFTVYFISLFMRAAFEEDAR
jgi:hypothetical protein